MDDDIRIPELVIGSADSYEIRQKIKKFLPIVGIVIAVILLVVVIIVLIMKMKPKGKSGDVNHTKENFAGEKYDPSFTQLDNIGVSSMKGY